MNHNQCPSNRNEESEVADPKVEPSLAESLDRENLVKLLGKHYDPDADPSTMEALGRSLQLEIETFKSIHPDIEADT